MKDELGVIGIDGHFYTYDVTNIANGYDVLYRFINIFLSEC